MSRSYVAFISYKHARRDAAIAKEVHTLIENYVIPASLRKGERKLGVVFRDEEELPISSDLSDSIQTALKASQYLILIASPGAIASPWVNREIEYFLQTHDAGKVFVVLAGGEPQDVFPEALTRIYHPDTGTYQEVEPLALDVRADTLRGSLKKLRERIRKLYAAMLGCSYDSLVQREKVRKMKRVMALAALLVMVAGCFAGVILSKNLELSQKNEELYQATQTALKREALLLTADAEQALDNNDAETALRNAAAALYDPDIERAYCAPAERVLFSALNVFGSETAVHPLVSRTTLNHHVPVADMVFSADGSQLYTIDDFGTVTGSSVSTGETAWSVTLPAHQASYSINANAQIWLDGENSAVLCAFHGTLASLDPGTGSLRWQHQLTGDLALGPFFDAPRQSLTYVEYRPDLSPDNFWQRVDYRLISLRTPDGTPEREVSLPSSDAGAASIDFSSDSLSGGCVTPSGRFVGSFFRTENEVCQSILFWLDPGDDTVHFIDNETFADPSARYTPIHTACLNDDRVVVLDSRNGIHMRCFSLTDDQLVWESAAAIHPSSHYALSSRYIVLPRTNDFLIGYGNCLYLIDANDGSLRSSSALNDQITSIWQVQSGFFGSALANGQYVVGWHSPLGLITHATLTLPEMTALVPYNMGLAQPDTAGDKVNGILLASPQEGGGRAACLSPDGLTVYIAAVLPAPSLVKPIPVQLQGDVSGIYGEYQYLSPAGMAILSPAGTTSDLRTTVIAPASRTCWQIPLDDAASSTSRYLLTRDGQGAIFCDGTGKIRHIRADGTVTDLSRYDTIPIATIDQVQYMIPRYASAAAMQASDGRVLSIRCDGTQIDTWLDDQPGAAIQLPDSIRWRLRTGLLTHSMLRVGSNGLLLLSHYAADDPQSLDSFAVYSTAEKTWRMIPDEAHGAADRLIVFSDQAPRFAVYDDDACIRLYDASGATPVQRIATSLPRDYVKAIGFLPGDGSLFYAATEDGQFILYSIPTGDIVFKTMFESKHYDADDFSVWADERGHRLYIRVEKDGLCVDTRSWEPIFTLGGDNSVFLFFDAARNEVCLMEPGFLDKPDALFMLPVPTTDELVQTALGVLKQMN